MNWDKVKKGSKITLKNTYSFIGMGDTKRELKPGFYYVVGFWADACGLSQNREDIKRQTSEVFIPSIDLRRFEGITQKARLTT